MNKIPLYTFLVTILLAINSMANNLTEGHYQIISKQFQKSINIPWASIKVGERLIVWDKNDCRFNQEWKFEKQGDFYAIRSKFNYMAITASGSKVQQYLYTGADNQLWIVSDTLNSFIIISKNTGLVMTVDSLNSVGLELVLKEKRSDNSQLWNIEPSGLEYMKADFNRILSPAEMKTDMDYFFKKLYEVHVNPYAFVSRDSLEQRKRELYAEIKKPMKRLEFARVISGINGLFDGHTGVDVYDKLYVNTYYYSYGSFFSYDISCKGNKIFIRSDIDSLNNQEIISINNIKVDSICREIKKRVSHENEKLMNYKVEANFKFYLIGLFNIQAPYQIEIKTSPDKILTYKTSGKPYFLFPGYQNTNERKYTFREYPEDSIAIIEYNT